MCGIVGIVSRDYPVSVRVLERMNSAMAYRGPDHGGIYVDHRPTMAVGLGNRRLSIVDLSTAANQPMTNTQGSLWIVYNGELYNHGALRATLEAQGYHHRSRSDTETVLYAYEALGLAAFQQFNGMFALAIYDKRREQVVLARDRMGIKPLYYWTNGRTTIFASELKTLLGHPLVPQVVDPLAVDLYLALGYIPSPFTILKDVRKLAPGHAAILNRKGIQIQPFWERTTSQPTHTPNPQALIPQTRHVVTNAITRQLASDVPVGVMLSGGIDSTIVAGVAQAHHADRLHSFAVGYAFNARVTASGATEHNDDLAYARVVSQQLGTQHHEIILEDRQLPTLLPQLVAQLDEPFGETTSPAIALIAQCAYNQGVKVLLTGDGSDEVFGGYGWYESLTRLERYERLPGIPLALAALKHFAPNDEMRWKACDLAQKVRRPPLDKYRQVYHLLPAADRRALLPPEINFQLNGASWEQVVAPFVEGQGALADRFAQADLYLWVRELFNPRLDRMTMRASVEARVPFQDNEVLDFANTIPMATKRHQGQSKYLLRQAFHEMIPAEILERPKRAFVGPMGTWLRGALREMAGDMLAPSQLSRFGLLATDRVVQMTQQAIYAPDDEHLTTVWSLLMLQLWCDHYLSQPTPSFEEVTNAP